MPRSALPDHLNDPGEIEAAFPDDSQYGSSWFGKLYRWYNKKTKTWFAFSYRCHEWWAQTEKFPLTLIAMRGRGYFRFECENGGEYLASIGRINSVNCLFPRMYLSRIQSYTRWHFAVQLCVWEKIPFVFPMVSFHFYPKKSDVPEAGGDTSQLKGKVWFGYAGHFDGDLVHWLLTSFYLGKSWK